MGDYSLRRGNTVLMSRRGREYVVGFTTTEKYDCIGCVLEEITKRGTATTNERGDRTAAEASKQARIAIEADNKLGRGEKAENGRKMEWCDKRGDGDAANEMSHGRRDEYS